MGVLGVESWWLLMDMYMWDDVASWLGAGGGAAQSILHHIFFICYIFTCSVDNCREEKGMDWKKKGGKSSCLGCTFCFWDFCGLHRVCNRLIQTVFRHSKVDAPRFRL